MKRMVVFVLVFSTMHAIAGADIPNLTCFPTAAVEVDFGLELDRVPYAAFPLIFKDGTVFLKLGDELSRFPGQLVRQTDTHYRISNTLLEFSDRSFSKLQTAGLASTKDPKGTLITMYKCERL